MGLLVLATMIAIVWLRCFGVGCLGVGFGFLVGWWFVLALVGLWC